MAISVDNVRDGIKFALQEMEKVIDDRIKDKINSKARMPTGGITVAMAEYNGKLMRPLMPAYLEKGWTRIEISGDEQYVSFFYDENKVIPSSTVLAEETNMRRIQVAAISS